ncbi:MAG: hypothetical protein OEZ13_02185 [Spirochaetia bacterium]|nr:hypothetical protein [Spirochaetia bacterium]
MTENKNSILRIYNFIREGSFKEASDEAFEIIKNDGNNFWALFLGSVAYGFLDNRKYFLEYLEKAKELDPESPYLWYLMAYSALWEEDLEKALWFWTKITETSEGWLAKELIEKARKRNSLVKMANEGQISNFFILPDFFNEIKPPDESQENAKQKKVTIQSKKKTRRINTSTLDTKKLKLKINQYQKTIFIVSFSALFFLLVFIFNDNIINLFNNQPTDIQSKDDNRWMKLSIESDASLSGSSVNPHPLYIYQNSENLVGDFNRAKQFLLEKKINQTRYYLQRILNSNADFKTKEKSKIFLKFIPEVDYEDFEDLLFVSEIRKEPEFFYDCLVLWEGRLVRLKDVENGKEIRMLINEKNVEYLVEGFLRTDEKKPTWLSHEEFKRKKYDISTGSQKAIVYGKFKGLLGAEKTVYLEIISFWN